MRVIMGSFTRHEVTIARDFIKEHKASIRAEFQGLNEQQWINVFDRLVDGEFGEVEQRFGMSVVEISEFDSRDGQAKDFDWDK